MIERTNGVKPPKIIFLDIDGVLATIRMDVATGSMSRFDPVGIAMLNRLCSEANAKIVISSSWAGDYQKNPQELFALFKAAGFTGEFHEDWCIDDWGDPKNSRGPSILRWAEKHRLEAENALIVDDSVIGNLPTAWKRRFVKTDAANGILYDSILLMEALFLGRTLNEGDFKTAAKAAHPDLGLSGVNEDIYRGR